MKKIGIIIFAAALILGLVFSSIFSFGRVRDKFFNFSVNFCGVEGSGNVTAEKRSVSGFKSVDVGGVFQVEITAGKDYAVEVEADDNLIPLIKTEVSGDVLKVELDKKVSTKNPLKVRISAPNIEGIEASGASKVSVAGIKNDSLSIDSSGASKMTIAGETADLKVEVSGASNIDAAGLNAVNATVDASGASHVDVNVSGDLKSDASGASRITYSGSPKNVEKKASGASSVSAK